MTAKVLDLDIGQGVPSAMDLGRYREALVLLRFKGRPVGAVRVPSPDGVITPERIWRAIEGQPDLTRRLAELPLLRRLTGEVPWPPERPACSFTIVVCTKDRPELLKQCLASLSKLCLGAGTVLVVDNNSSEDSTWSVVDEFGFEYAREPVIGLNAARRRAAKCATGDILLFLDDDAVVDAAWLDAMLEPFTEARVGAATGLAMPLELDTDAQELFERYTGFGRGFQRADFDLATLAPSAAGVVGSGVSMAIRSSLIDELELFEPELDVGTAALSGGDHYAFSRILAAGYKIVYQPTALVWHRHRPDYQAMKQTVVGYSVGVYVMLTRRVILDRDLQALRVGWSWFRSHHLRELRRSLLHQPGAVPLDLVVAEIMGALRGPGVYVKTRGCERHRTDEFVSV